jgi:hypothetical protein
MEENIDEGQITDKDDEWTGFDRAPDFGTILVRSREAKWKFRLRSLATIA